LIALSFMDFFLEDERDTYASKIKKLKELNQVKNINKTGEVRFVNIRVSPFEYPGRKVLLVTAGDITKGLEAQIQLIQAGKMATIGEMATGVAHELNQPLTVIKTASNYLIKKARKNEAIPQDILLTMADEIDRHVDRAANTINHMRQFGRKYDITLEEVQVNAILKQSFEIFSQQFKLREINVVWNLDDSVSLVSAETNRLEQVFINLLINARDAIDEKRQINGNNTDLLREIQITTCSEKDSIIIKIHDSGVGIPEAIIDKIFEPFFTTKTIGEGTGIGLSISYGIIQDFGGRLQVSSVKGEGSCFTIYLPRSKAE
jgi:C4-dicarboxylate-specific signal transduction histidine kinase